LPIHSSTSGGISRSRSSAHTCRAAAWACWTPPGE